MTDKKYAAARGVDFKYARGETDIYGNTFHHRFELYLLLGGSVTLITDRARIPLCPYQLAIIPPGQFHQFTVKGNVNDYERCVLNLDADFIDSDILKSALSCKELLTLSPDERIVNNMLHIKKQIENGHKDDISFLLPAIATDIIFSIKNTPFSANPPHDDMGILSHKIIRYINAHYSEAIDLDTLAKTFHLSVSSLCHIFKQDFSITVKQYIIQKRLNAARSALNRGERSEDVCQKVGFTNYSAFFRLYKKQFGMSPSRSKEQL